MPVGHALSDLLVPFDLALCSTSKGARPGPARDSGLAPPGSLQPLDRLFFAPLRERPFLINLIGRSLISLISLLLNGRFFNDRLRQIVP